jgi:hypothetical protein
MARLSLILCLLLFCQSSLLFGQYPLADLVEEYKETKNGVTLITSISLRDSAQRRIFDKFLFHLGNKLKRPNRKFNILILVDWKTRNWNGAIGFDTVRFDYNFMVDYYYPPRPKGDTTEVVLEQVSEKDAIDTNYEPIRIEPPNWNGSYDKSEKDLGLKILYKSPISDSNVFFDRIYSLAKYGIDHLERIKNEQKGMEMGYDGYLLSVLTIDTSEIKRIPLISSGFDPNKIEIESKDNRLIWIVSSIILLALILFFILKKASP